jgi:putative ABC transport system substrate-binding protein
VGIGRATQVNFSPSSVPSFVGTMPSPEPGFDMNRRAFLGVLGSAAAAWPLAARAQQGERVRLIGILLPAAADQPVFQRRVGAFLQALGQSGWSIGHNLRIDIRWATGNDAALRRHAAELAALAPDVILAHGSPSVAPLLQATRSAALASEASGQRGDPRARAVPIVFAVVTDPVGAGLVDSLARPGGNATGFLSYEYSLSGKWPELLKQIAPDVTRVGVLWEPTLSSGIGQLAAIRAAAPAFGLEVSTLNIQGAGEIEREIATFAGAANGGLIVTASGAVFHRDLIIALASRYRLPTVYYERLFVTAGGLVSYGPDYIDQYRRAAGYVDRILKGEKPADLPVQAPVKYEMVVNLKTAKALGLDPPWRTVLARADELIE